MKILALIALLILPALSAAQTPTVEMPEIFVPAGGGYRSTNRDADALLAQAVNAFSARDYDTALRTLDQLTALTPEDPTPLVNKAAIHVIRGAAQYNAAVFLTTPAVRKLSQDAAKDELRQAVIDADKATELLDALLKKPGFVRSAEQFRKHVLRARAFAMSVSSMLIDPSTSSAALEAFHDYLPLEDNAAEKLLGQLKAAEMMLKAGKPDVAAEEYRKAVALDPANVEAILGEAVSRIDVAYLTNDDAKQREGVEQLKFFVSQAPDSNKYKGSAEEAVRFLAQPQQVTDSSQYLYVQGDSDSKDGKAQEGQQGHVQNGKALSLPAPSYPLVAKMAKADGTVEVQLFIDEEGNVTAARANAGHPLLQAAAVAAARKAKLSPTTVDGKPVKVTGTVNYNFKL
jgi:TonB family protein